MPLTIGRKLAIAVALAVGVSALVTSGISINQEISRYMRSRRETLVATANAFSAAIAGPLAAGNEDGVFEALRGIGQVPHLLRAGARNTAGKMLGQIGYAARLDRDPTIGGGLEPSVWDLIQSQSIAVVVPVVDSGTEVGSLELLSDAGDIWEGLIAAVGANVAGAGIALTAGLLIAGRLQQSITKPLRGLTSAMERVKDHHDFKLALPHSSSDEVGVLIAGFNAMLADIRERDSQLVRHRDRLEQDIAERTSDLAAAKTLAEQANVAKSTFLATMSHEIRTPMTGLLVMAELLEDSDLPMQARRYAEVISRSGSALLSIINDILDFSKIEAGKLETEHVRVDVRSVVETVVALFFARAIEKGLDLAASFTADVPLTIEGDPGRLQQVISNLVNNALKFTKRGSVMIETFCDPAGKLCFEVVDTGIGIPADKIDHIFQAFSQADGTTTREFGGTGLGLAICGRLADAMGGHVEARSVAGEGSTFAFTVPMHVLDPAPVWPQRPPAEPHNAIIVVDAPATRQAVSNALALAGFSVSHEQIAGTVNRPELLVLDAGAAAVLGGRRPSAAIVIGLAAPGQHGAEKWFRSVDLMLSLPIVEGDIRVALARWAQGEVLQVAVPRAASAPLRGFAHAKVLVVDDTAVNREVMVEALRRFDIVPDLATNGLEALAAAESTEYDIVLMDGSMPELDGFEACKRLRASEADTRRTPVIALTAHVIGVTADAWREAGMDGVLHKPFTMSELQRTLTAWLGEPGEVVAPLTPAATNDQELDCDTDPLLDDAILNEITSVSQGVENTFAQRVFALFLQHAPVALETLERALNNHDLDAVAASAHAMKSMSLNIGARQVGARAGRVESAARAGHVAPLVVQSLASALSSTTRELSIRLAATEGPAGGAVASCVGIR